MEADASDREGGRVRALLAVRLFFFFWTREVGRKKKEEVGVESASEEKKN